MRSQCYIINDYMSFNLKYVERFSIDMKRRRKMLDVKFWRRPTNFCVYCSSSLLGIASYLSVIKELILACSVESKFLNVGLNVWSGGFYSPSPLNLVKRLTLGEPQGNAIWLFLLDLAVAFNTISHDIILKKLLRL